MADQDRQARADDAAARERPSHDDDSHRAHEGADYSPEDATRAGHRSFENTSIAADQREQTESRERVVRGNQLDEAGEPPDPLEGREP